MSVNTTPRTWVTGEVVTATELNAEVRDLGAGVQAAWDTYTPSWTATGTNPSLGNGTSVGRYLQVGKTITFMVQITAGSTTTFGAGRFCVSLPIAERGTTIMWAVHGSVYDQSTDMKWACHASKYATNGRVELEVDAGTAGNAMRNVTSTAPFTWTTGDLFFLCGTYEAA